jgi:hypothetical protein
MINDLETLRLSLLTELAASVEECMECEGRKWRLFGQATRVSLEVDMQQDGHLLITLANSLVIESDEGLAVLQTLLKRFDREEAFVVLSSSTLGRLYWWIEIGGLQVLARQYGSWSWRSRGSRTQERVPLREGATYL